MSKATDSTVEDIGDINTIPEAIIVEKWATGSSARQIAQELGLPVGTVYKILKKRQKAIIKEDGISYHEKQTDI